MSVHTFTSSEIELRNGKPFDPSRPDHRAITLEVVARSLSKQVRYGGHDMTDHGQSIAEHAVLVSLKLGRVGAPLTEQMAGLHHDDHEALDGFGDIQRPTKSAIQTAEYEARVRRLDHCVWRALAWPNKASSPLWDTAKLHCGLVKRVDNWAVTFEARHIMPSGGEGWEQSLIEEGGLPPIPDHDDDMLWCWTAPDAYFEYVRRHRELARAITSQAVAA